MDGDFVSYFLRFFAQIVVYGCSKRDFLVLADEPAVDVTFVGEEQCIAAFPGDGEGFPEDFYRVGEGKVAIQVVYDVAQAHAIDSSPKRGKLDDILGKGGPRQKNTQRQKLFNGKSLLISALVKYNFSFWGIFVNDNKNVDFFSMS